jgi:hypothetical protein
LVHKERRQGRRFFGIKLRDRLDSFVEETGEKISKGWEHFSKYIVQLNWYYSIHSVLKAMLRVIVAFYTYFENIFEQNRERTKQLRAEKRQLNESNHLKQMTSHKEDTALTPAQKKKLSHKNLEGKD